MGKMDHKFNFSIPPSDFDAKYAYEITYMLRKVFSQILESKSETIILSHSDSDKILKMLDLMGNAYWQLTKDYFKALLQYEKTEGSRIEFRVDRCQEEFMESDYTSLVKVLQNKILKKQSNQLKYLINECKKFRATDFNPNSIEITLVEITMPSNTSDMEKFVKNFQSIYNYIVTDNFSYHYLLSCIFWLAKREIIQAEDILNVHQELPSAKSLQRRALDTVNSIKSFSDIFYGNFNKSRQGNDVEMVAAIHWASLANRVDMLSKKENAIKQLTSQVSGMKLPVYIFDKFYHRAKNKIKLSKPV